MNPGISLLLLFAVAVGSIQAQGNTQIINTRHPLYIVPSGNLSLTCVQSEGRKVEWFFNGEIIDENTETGFIDIKKLNQRSSETITILEKRNLQSEDGGIYTCRSIMDPRRPDWKESEYNIEVKITNNSDPEYSSIVAHNAEASKPADDVELGCSTTGSQFDDAELHWMRNGEQIEDKDGKYRLKPENNTLGIKDVDYLEDLGEYTCKFNLLSGNSQEEIVYLYAKPYVNAFDTSKNLVQGDTLTLRCDAYGYPTPSAVWMKDEDMVNEDSRTSLEEHNSIENGTLKVMNVDYPDAGDYMCKANNNLGSHNSTIIIRVKDKLAALWPFLAICAEVFILCVIIFIYEKRRAKKMAEEDAKEEADHLTNSHANRDELRQRKV